MNILRIDRVAGAAILDSLTSVPKTESGFERLCHRGIRAKRWRQNKSLHRRATRRPDAKAAPANEALEERGKDRRFQGVENARIAEEAGDIDEQVLIESGDFGRIALDESEIVVELFDFVYDHTALNATENGALAVVSEVEAGGARTS